MLRYAVFKKCTVPSPLRSLDMTKLTGAQKLDLVRLRIFGDMIPGNYPTGYKVLKAKLSGQSRLEYYTNQFAAELNPLIKPLVHSTAKRYKIFRLMRRNAMRGIKLNKKRGGIGSEIVSQFGEVKKGAGAAGAASSFQGEKPKQEKPKAPKEDSEDKGKKGGKKGKKGDED